jgi:hypothetical protein
MCGCREESATVASSDTLVSTLQQRAILEHLESSMLQMDRKLSKMQSRVLLCVEQYRGVRTSSDAARSTMNTVLSTHGTALAELQEQTNSLQKVVSSMQDVVVKQIQVCSAMDSSTTLLHGLPHRYKAVPAYACIAALHRDQSSGQCWSGFRMWSSDCVTVQVHALSLKSI